MKLRNRLKYAILAAGILALASPTKTTSSDLDFMVLNLKKFKIMAPLEQRLRLVDGMEPEALARIVGYDSYIREASLEYPVSPSHLYSMIYQESRGNPKARSPKKAEGLMQITPITREHLDMTREEVLDPQSAIRGGARYYSDLLSYYGGNKVLALAAYNMGPGKVNYLLRKRKLNPEDVTYDDVKTALNRETRNYIQDVLSNSEAISKYL